MSRVLVLDARTVAALAATRSLGASGIEVTCAEAFRNNPASYSRYASKIVTHSDPDLYPDRFLGELEEQLSRGAYSTVLPMRGITTMLLGEHRQRFERHVRFCLADYEALLVGYDKGRTIHTALEFGLPVPETYFPEEQSLESIARSINYPALIKPRRLSGGRGIVLAWDADSLFEQYPCAKAKHGEPIIQEWIPPGRKHLSACFLFNFSSQLRAAFVYEELRTYPVRGGPATFAVSVQRPEVVELGAAFLRRLGWRGVAHMDLMIDPRDEQIKLLELNPRFWTSLALAIHAGVDFPRLLYRIVADGDVAPVLDYRAGCSYRWLLPADLLWFLSATKSWENAREFASFRRPGLAYAICSTSDPVPILGAVLQSLGFLAKRPTRDFFLSRGW